MSTNGGAPVAVGDVKIAEPTTQRVLKWARKSMALLGLGVLFLIAGVFRHCTAKDSIWETNLPAAFPAMRVDIPPGVEAVHLHLDEPEPHVGFYLATSRGAVPAFRNAQKTEPTQKAANDILECDGQLPAALGKDQNEACGKTGNVVSIRVRRDAVKRPPPPDGGSAKKTGKTGKQAAPPPEPAPPPGDKGDTAVSTWRELWLVPTHPSAYGGMHAATRLGWSEVEITRHGYAGRPPDVVRAADCDARELSDAVADGCRIPGALLGNATFANGSHPNRAVTLFAEVTERRILPVLLTALGLLDLFLFFGLAGLLGAWVLKASAFQKRPSTGGVIDAEHAKRGLKSFLQWLESMGPAVAFALTVVALLLTFHRHAPGEGDDRALGREISTAMAATFLGLLTRVLANTIERIVDHLTRWNAAEDGLILPLHEEQKRASAQQSPDPAAATATAQSVVAVQGVTS